MRLICRDVPLAHLAGQRHHEVLRRVVLLPIPPPGEVAYPALKLLDRHGMHGTWSRAVRSPWRQGLPVRRQFRASGIGDALEPNPGNISRRFARVDLIIVQEESHKERIGLAGVSQIYVHLASILGAIGF